MAVILEIANPAPPTFTDVSPDVLARHPIRWSRGIFGSDPTELVARPGSLTFTLNNGASNSVGKAGYYSPGHPNQWFPFTIGQVVRLKVEGRFVFRGKLISIIPSAGEFGSGETACVCEDWMGELAKASGLELALQEGKRADELITSLVADLPTAPSNSDYDTGVDTFPFAFDDLGGRVVAMEVVQAIAQSERAYFYVRGDASQGETFTMENRTVRQSLTPFGTVIDKTLIAYGDDSLQVPTGLDRAVGDIKLTVYPRRVDTSNVNLVRLDAAVSVPAGGSVTLFADYRDPNNEAEFVGGKTMVSPVANTDFTANTAEDGTGTDITADFTVTPTFFGSSVKLVIDNANASAGFLRGESGNTGMRVRGLGLYRFKAVEVRVVAAGAPGTRVLDIDMPYQSNPNTAEGVGNLLLALYGGLGNVPTKVRVLTEIPSVLTTMKDVDIGDLLHIAEEQTAVGSFGTGSPTPVSVIVHGIEQEINNGIPTTWWTLAPVDTTQALIFDHAEFGKFDSYGFGHG